MKKKKERDKKLLILEYVYKATSIIINIIKLLSYLGLCN